MYDSPSGDIMFAQELEDTVTTTEHESGEDDDEGFILSPENALAQETSANRSIVATSIHETNEGNSEVEIVVNEGALALANDGRFESPDSLLLRGNDAASELHEMDTGTSNVDEWIKTLQKLVRGKARLDREDIQRVSDILNKANGSTLTAHDIIENPELREAIIAISKLPEGEIPFGDEHALCVRAREIAGHLL